MKDSVEKTDPSKMICYQCAGIESDWLKHVHALFSHLSPLVLSEARPFSCNVSFGGTLICLTWKTAPVGKQQEVVLDQRLDRMFHLKRGTCSVLSLRAECTQDVRDRLDAEQGTNVSEL